MNIIKNIFVLIFALVLTLLDVSFFSAIPFHDATIVTTFLFVIIFSLLSISERFLVFSVAAIIFFSIFSSLPAWVLIISFFLIPETILYLRRTVVPEPSVPVSFFIFVVVNFIFESLLLVFAKELNPAGLSALGYFVLLNSLAGVLFYYILKKLKDRYKVSEVNI